MYLEQDLVAIAKRENNQKRNYLVVNRLQGKHVRVSPKKTMELFSSLGDQIYKKYHTERLLLIGFAETATAIGAALAVQLNSYYIQTTRENIPGAEYFYFSESHSHATEQKLVKNELDRMIHLVDRILFIEDEVTTGNTIYKIIQLMKKQYGKQLNFSVASLLNGMNREAEAFYEQEKIETLYLVKTNHDRYSEIAGKYLGNGSYHKEGTVYGLTVQNIDVNCGYENARRLVSGKSYEHACEQLYTEIARQVLFHGHESVLVLGTEEFMYPPFYVARRIEENGLDVRFHATTRSPIEVSLETEYPLHERYELLSLYEESRRTFVYDLKKYDKVLIITDAVKASKQAVETLLHALDLAGNQEVYFINWR